jgi:hypothetical protein
LVKLIGKDDIYGLLFNVLIVRNVQFEILYPSACVFEVLNCALTVMFNVFSHTSMLHNGYIFVLKYQSVENYTNDLLVVPNFRGIFISRQVPLIMAYSLTFELKE